MDTEYTPHTELKVGDRVRIVETHPLDGYHSPGPFSVGHEFTITEIDNKNAPPGFCGFDGKTDAECYFAVRVLKIGGKP